MYQVHMTKGSVTCEDKGAVDMGTYEFGRCIPIDRDNETRGMIVRPRHGYDGLYIDTYPDRECLKPQNDSINSLRFDGCLHGLNNSYKMNILSDDPPGCELTDLFRTNGKCVAVRWKNSPVKSLRIESLDPHIMTATGRTFYDAECKDYYQYETFDRNICIGNV